MDERNSPDDFTDRQLRMAEINAGVEKTTAICQAVGTTVISLMLGVGFIVLCILLVNEGSRAVVKDLGWWGFLLAMPSVLVPVLGRLFLNRSGNAKARVRKLEGYLDPKRTSSLPPGEDD